MDHIFRRAFLLNHIHFMSSDKLLSKIEEYYNVLHYNDRVNVAKKLNLVSTGFVMQSDEGCSPCVRACARA